jgi:hypothetical protein
MIYLFDNCYLSTTNSVVETCKQVWIGSHPKIQDPMLDLTYDILHSYEEIDDEQLDELFNNIHQEYSDVKTVIYCDINNFMYVYSYFFNGILETNAVKELYSFDMLKENYRIGTFAIRDVEFVNLPKTLTGTDTSSTFSSLLTETRIEIAFANSVRGNEDAFNFCVDRATKMYDGSPGFWERDAEQNLPALLSDEEFTIANLINEEFIESFVSQFKVDTVIANNILPILQEKFGFDFMTHYFTVINDCADYEEFWEDLSSLNKEDFIKNYMLDPAKAIKLQLVFPNLSNFDSINPILWNQILKNKNNTLWLNEFKVKNGTYN